MVFETVKSKINCLPKDLDFITVRYVTLKYDDVDLTSFQNAVYR